MNPYLVTSGGWAAISGGRTSGFMLFRMLQTHEDDGTPFPDDFLFLFCNTGLEDERTYEFVRRMQTTWGIDIVWLEYQRSDGPIVEFKGNSHQIGCHGFKVVDFDTASRNGEPFRQLLEVKRDYRAVAKGLPPVLPNVPQRFCSGELKARTMLRYYESRFGRGPRAEYIGIRSDEESRVVRLQETVAAYRTMKAPLVDDHVDEEEVLVFWKNAPFDLAIPHDPEMGTYLGNCRGCFLKKKSKLARINREYPDALEFYAQVEEEFGQTFRKDRPTYRQIMSGALELPVCGTDEDETACSCTD